MRNEVRWLLKWIMSANPTVFDHKAAFKKNGFIDWNQTRNFSVGDIVYIYCSKPISRIMYITKVEKINMLASEVIEEEVWWKKTHVQKNRYMRLRLISYVESVELALSNLQKNGMRYAPQSPSIVKSELQRYIDQILEVEDKNENKKTD